MKPNNKIKLIIYSVFALLFIFILGAFFIKPKEKIRDRSIYTLKSYRNCVALYENQELIEVYDEIVLNSLPVTDRKNLNKGINFDNKSQVHIALEDYDS